MTDTALPAREEWKRHWRLVVAASIGFSFTSFMAPAIGLFMEPLKTEFGWSRTQISSGLGVAAALSVLASPFFGVLLDRWGARRIALPGLVLLSAGVASFGLASGSFVQWMCLWALWGFAALFVHSTTWSTAVASVFVAGRGLALGLTLSGTALAQVVVPPLTNWLIEIQGWRQAFFYLGGGWGGLALILSIFFLYDARDRTRLHMDAVVTKAEQNVPLAGLTIAQAWRSTELWRVAISTFLILVITIGVLIHQFPILVEAGETRTRAAWLASLFGVAGIVGKLVTGTLLDRFHARWVGGITLASTAIAYPMFLAEFRTPVLIVIAMMISGYAAGTKIQLCSYLTTRYGGMRHYGAIFGFMASLIALASAVGPLAGGFAYDKFGSYGPFLVWGAGISLFCGVLIFSLGKYPDWSTEEGTSKQV